MNVNRLFFAGNCTRDIDLKFLPNQTPCAEWGVACNKKYKTQSGEQKEEVVFLDCVAFGRTAEVIAEHFNKGKPIWLEGSLRYESWEKDGRKQSRLKMLVNTFQFIGGREGGGNGGDAGEDQTRPARRQAAAPKSKFPSEALPEGEIDPSEIPF